MAERPSWESPDQQQATGRPSWEAAPSGMNQPTWTSSNGSRATWATGGQRGSIENGWNTPFYETMFKQRDESDKKKEDATSRDDFTGVVTYDNIVQTRGGKSRDLKLGDVYENGERVENVYDYGKDQGNAILAQLSLDAKTQKELFNGANGDQTRIESAILKAASERTQAAEAVRQQQGFLADREEVEDQWGVFAPIATVIGGAGAGAAAGAGVGGAIGLAGAGVAAAPGALVGGIIGGAVGGVGALLNQDELIDQFAEAQVKLNRANELNNPLLSASTAIGEYAGALGALAQPLTNLGVGTADALTGGFANDVGAREEEALRDNLMLEGARFGLAFADAFAQFAGPAGVGIYMTTMGGVTAGGVGTLLTGQQWDDRQREFNPIADSGNALEDVGRWASAIGAVGIDAIQTFAPAQILRAADRVGGTAGRMGGPMPGAFGFESKIVNAANGGSKTALTTAKLLGLETNATKIAGGRTFNVVDGRISSVSRTPNVTLLAPSEAVGWLSVRAKAMLSNTRGKAVTAEDLYASALQIRELSVKKAALLTGFAEGTEEVAQSFLQNWAGGYSPSVDELARAAAGGFAAGAGMSAGAMIGRDPIMAGYQQVNDVNALLGAEQMSVADWRALTSTQRESLKQTQPAIAATALQAREDLTEDQRDEAFDSMILRQVAEDNAVKVLEAEQAKGLPAGERTWKIAGIGNPGVGSDVVRIETQAMIQALETHRAAFEETGRTASADALGTLTFQSKYLLQRVLQNPQLATTDVLQQPVMRADGTEIPAGVNSITAVNTLLKDAFEGKGVVAAPGETATWTPEEARQSAELVYQRSPSDSNSSWVMLRPEIDTELTRLTEPGVPVKAWFVNHAVLKGLSGDFDGDGTALRSFLNLADSDVARERLRLGLNLQAEDTIVIDSYAGELAYASAIIRHKDKNDPTKHIQKTLKRAVDEITALLAPAQRMPNAELKRAVKKNLMQVLIKGNDPEAKQVFWEWLTTTGLVEEASVNSGERVLFRINDAWVQAIFEIGMTISIENGGKPPADWDTNNVEEQGAIPDSKARNRNAAPAATLFQEAQQVTTGNDDIRVKQKFNYSPLASQTMDSDVMTNDVMMWAQRLYRILSSGTTRPQTDLATRTDEVANYARNSLKDLLIEWNKERTSSNLSPISLADLARIQAPNVDLGRAAVGIVSFNDENVNVSIVQLALQNAVQHFRAVDAVVLDVNDGSLRRKYSSLARLDMKGAAREVFRESTMEELVGLVPASRMFWKQQTLGDVIADYSALGQSDRRNVMRRARELKDVYGKSPSTELAQSPDTVGEVHAFRVFMDIIQTEGNEFITMDDTGLASKNTIMGAQDSSAIDALEWSSKGVRQILLDSSAALGVRRHGLLRGKNSRLTVEQVRDLFDLDPSLGRKIAETIPQELALTVFSADDNGRLHVPHWFYEFLVEENSELAAYKFWRGLLLAQMNNEVKRPGGTVSNDRLVALYQLLGDADSTGRQVARFERALESSQSIREFLSFVNINLNGDRPPQMAVLRDQVALDVNFSKGGWQRSGSSSDFRKRIQALREQVARSAESLNETLAEAERSEAFSYKLEKRDPNAMAQLQKAIDRAKLMPTGTGPRILINALLSMAVGFVGNESEKAKTARGTEGIGHVAMLEQATWGTPLQQLLAAWTSSSEMSVLSRPDRLLHPMSFTLQNGTPVEWPGLTVELAIELNADRAMRPLLYAALGPTVFDQAVEEGQASLQHLTSPSISDIVAEPKVAFSRILGGSRFEDYMKFASMVDAKAGENRVLLYAAQILVARTSGATRRLNEKQYLQYTEDAFETAVKTLRALAQVPIGQRPAMAQLLADFKPKAPLQDPSDPNLTTLEAARALTVQALVQDALLEQLKGATGSTFATRKAQHQRIMDMLTANSSGQALVKAYMIPEDESQQHDVKLRLWKEAKQRGDFWNFVQGADGALAREFLGRSTDRAGYPTEGMNEATAEKYWTALSRALIVYKLGAGKGQVTASPEARATMAIDDADFRLFLGDWSFLYDIADPIDGDYTLWDSSRDVVESLNGSPVTGDPAEHFVEVLRKEIFENDVYPLGVHSSSVVQQYLNAKNRSVQAPAEAAISMYGTNPALNIALAAATRYTTQHPDSVNAPTRTYTFTGSDLVSLDSNNSVIPLTRNDFLNSRSFGNGQEDSLSRLQGRFVKQIVVTDSQGQQIDLENVLVPASLTSRAIPGTETSGLRVTSPGQIILALKAKGITLGVADLTIAVEFYHPDDRPAEEGWENNVYFDGVPSGNGSDAGISLVSADQQNNGQTQSGSRRALDALKKAKAALINPDLPNRLTVKAAEDPFNMAATIDHKVAQIMESDEAISLIGVSGINRIRKQMLVQTIVRGIDEQGIVQVYSAGDLIAHQRKSPGTLPVNMTQPQVQTIPIDFVLDLLGEQGTKGTRLNMNAAAFSSSITAWDNWKGRWDRAQLVDVMPGLFDPESFEFSVKSISESLFAKSSFMRTSRPSRISSQRELIKYTEKIDRWAADQARGGIANRTESPAVRETLKENSEKNYETVREWEKNANNAPIVPLARLQVPASAGLSDQESSRLRRGLDAAQGAVQLQAALSVADNGASWILDISGNKGPAEGYLRSMADLDYNSESQGKARGLNPIPGDVIFMDPGQSGFSQSIVETAIDAGYKVSLTGPASSSGEIKILKDNLIETGRFTLNKGVWELRNPAIGSQTAHARETALLAIVRRKTDHMVGVFADLHLEGEQAAFIRNPEALQGREVWVGKTLVQSNAFPGFQRPGSPESITAVDKYLNAFEGPDSGAWVQHLAKLGKTTVEEIMPFIERAILNTDRNTGLPKTWEGNGDAARALEIGDFVFLVDQHNQVLITRHGHKPYETQDNNRTRDEQLATPITPDGERAGVVMFTAELDDAPTFYEGVIHHWELDSTGLVAQLRVPLSALSDKMIFTDDGLKIFGNALSNSGFDVTQMDISRKIPLSYIISLADHVSKEGRAIDNAADAITYFGFDATEAYANVLLGTDKVTWDGAVREYRAGKPEKYQDIRASVKLALEQYQRGWRSAYMSSLDAQDYVTQLSGDFNSLTEGMQTLLNMLPQESQDKLGDSINITPELQMTLAAMAYLGTPSASVEDILSTSGVDNPANEVVSMPEVFTNLFVQAGANSDLREWFFNRLNARLPHRTNPDGSFEGYHLRKVDFMMEIYTPGQPMREGLYSFKEAHSTGSDNGALFSQSFEHSTTQNSSESLRNMAILALYGADAGHSSRKVENKYKSYLEGRAFDASTAEGLSDIFRGIRAKYIAPVNKSTLATPAEVMSQKLGAYNVDAFSQTFDMKGQERGWTKETRNKFEARAKAMFRDNYLDPKEWEIVHGWIRRYLWRPKEADSTSDMAEYGHVSYAAAMDSLLAIENNLNQGRFPTWLADVPSMTADEVSMFALAYERSGGKGFIPSPRPWDKKLEKNDPLRRGDSFDPKKLSGPALHEYFYEAALGEMLESSITSLNQTAVDGFMHTYQAVFDNGGTLPSSLDPLRRLQLLDPDFNNIVLSLDPNYRNLLKVIPLDDVVDMRVSDVFGGTFLGGKYERSYLGKDEIGKAQARQQAWKKERNIADSFLSGHDIAQRGHILRTNDATSNALMRVLMNIRLANGMFHPWLFASAPLETAVRNIFENSVMLLTGDSFSKTGQAARTIDDRVRNSAFGQGGMYKALSGNAKPVFELDTLVHAQDVVTSLAHNPEAVSMIHKDLYQDQKAHNGRIERGTEKLVRVFGKWQDPSYGITPKSSAKRIVGAVMRHFETVGTENGRGIDEALTLLARSPQQFRKEHPVAYALSLNSLANARTVKATSFSIFARSVIDPLSNNHNALVNIPSNLMLKIPFAFQNYAFNAATNMLGLQGVDAMLALVLQGRQSGKAWGRTQAWLSGNADSFDARQHGVDYLGNVLESVNFADAFIRAGMTHTALAGLGLLLGGLAGGDDEEKKRRRREEMLGVGHVYDPRDFQNDWRNADAIYLDGIPGLEQMFKVTDENGESSSPAELHWTLKQFISPVVGISKFINTGNFNHIFWGFGDALGNMPLINAMDWNDAATTATALYSKSLDAEAAAEDGSDETILGAATQFFLDGTARLERMLFENSFINSVYVAADKYDRDPWTLQDIDADGIIQRDNLNQPMETTAMDEYLKTDKFQSGSVWLDPNNPQVTNPGSTEPLEDPEFALGKVSRQGLFGQLRSYSETRATLAFFGSLCTGSFGTQNSLSRYDMAPREYSIEKQATMADEAAAFVLSEWDGDNEVLNLAGGEAFLKSIHAGYIQTDSPVLDNIYLTFDQRVDLSARFEAQYRQSQTDLGFTVEEIDKGWSAYWYGTDDNPWATPLFDVVWSKGDHLDQIPYDATSTYRQLNTTWTMGPDGKPWATGIARGELYNFFGQAPLNAYSGAGEGDPIGNLGIDGRLNSTDEVGNVNTGMRSLEKVNATIANPTDEDILAALKQISADVKDSIKGTSYNRDGGGYNRYGGGGGGGGGSSYSNNTFMPFQNDMKNPYIDNVPGIYINNPTVRRSDIRRQRFSSERGRLNQWQ